jgi:hypothetical protein
MGNGIKEWIRKDFPLYFGLAVVVVNFVIGFDIKGFNAEQAALWMTAVNVVAATIVALLTKPVAPTVFVYAFGAITALVAAYGYNVTPDQLAQLNALVQGIMVFLLRNQISPNRDAPFTGVLGAAEPPVITSAKRQERDSGASMSRDSGALKSDRVGKNWI